MFLTRRSKCSYLIIRKGHSFCMILMMEVLFNLCFLIPNMLFWVTYFEAIFSANNAQNIMFTAKRSCQFTSLILLIANVRLFQLSVCSIVLFLIANQFLCCLVGKRSLQKHSNKIRCSFIKFWIIIDANSCMVVIHRDFLYSTDNGEVLAIQDKRNAKRNKIHM